MASLLSYALTNLSDTKESLGIASSDTSKDNLIIRNINKATRTIENYCGRRFKETTYTDDLYSATGTDQLILRQRPLTATTPFVFKVRDTSLNIADFESIDSSLYFCDTGSPQGNAGVVDLLFWAVGRWDRYAITYSAGYSTIPEDLAEACVDLACYYVNNAGATAVGIKKKQEGQRSLEYSNNNYLLTFDSIVSQLGIDSILNSYANNPILFNRQS